MNNTNQAETSAPIFSVTISLTGCNFSIDTTQLNVLLSALVDTDPALQEQLDNIQNDLRETYRRTAPAFEELLTSIFGEVTKSEIKSVSESTIFYIGGDDNEQNEYQ